MKTYLYKFLGYLLISLAIALTFGPFDGNPFAKKYDPVQRERFCRQYPQSCESVKKENNHKLFVTYPKLAYLKYLFGTILFFFGIVALRKSYKHLPGIRISTNTIAVIEDIIGIFFLSFAAYCVWAYFFHHLTEAKIYLYDYDGDALGLDMTAFFFVPVTVVLSFFASNITGQSIEIDSEGITVHYPKDSVNLKWNEIDGFILHDTFTVIGGEGWILPRHMQTKLSVKTNKDTFSVYEPGLKKTKKKITALLRQYAPSALQNDIEKLSNEW